MKVKVYPRKTGFTGEFSVPPDKSITHRAYIIGGLAKKEVLIENPLRAKDCNSTLECLKKCGIHVEDRGEKVTIKGDYREPEDILDAGNSGTTSRILMGILSSYPFFSIITGDESLRRRPMGRVIKPLKMMGATIIGRDNDRFLPVAIKGGNLKGIKYELEVPSAQVKSAIILAGLRAEGETVVIEQFKSRNHTENMLKALGAKITIDDNKVTVKSSEIEGFKLRVPLDPSSASFLLTIALLVPSSEVIIKEVLLNPYRIGYFKKLKEMGCNINWEITEWRLNEPVGTVWAKYTGCIKGVKVTKEEVPSIIDELPLLALVATQSEGKTEIVGAEELRVKESDRIKAVVEELGKLGAKIEELPDGMIIEGPTVLKGGNVHSHRDHRIAMMLAIAGLISKEGVEIDSAEWVDISFPGFFQLIL
ncbi:MAG: 3-phosphoshikimate 1-carboxyvinyltransferase [Thermosulfidibacteraceae bacterium]|jgi:3-phosphoshikimate 1-carboxyvinyltransferase